MSDHPVCGGSVGFADFLLMPQPPLLCEQKKALEEFVAARGTPTGPWVALLRSPEVMTRARALSDYLRFKSVLPHDGPPVDAAVRVERPLSTRSERRAETRHCEGDRGGPAPGAHGARTRKSFTTFAWNCIEIKVSATPLMLGQRQNSVSKRLSTR